MTRPITSSIRFTLNPDTAPPGLILHGWEPEFEITAKLYPAEPATASCDQYGGDVNITKILAANPSCHCGWCIRKAAAFLDLLESDMALRHQIEELLCEEAQARAEFAAEQDMDWRRDFNREER
jgi:hypothetical protein